MRGMLAALSLVACVLFANPAVRADSARARALVEEGKRAVLDGQARSALELFERAIAVDPSQPQSYEEALPLWIQLGHLAEARKQLEGLTLRCDDCVFAWYGLGAIYRKQRRFDLAGMAYEVVLSKRPDDADAQFGLAMSLAALDDPRTVAALQRYLRIESRPERAAYRAHAERLLKSFGASIPKRELAANAALARVAELIEAKQFLSAESLLNQSGEQGRVALRLRAEIAKARDERLAAWCFSAVARLFDVGR